MSSAALRRTVLGIVAGLSLAVNIGATPALAETTSTKFQLRVPVIYMHHVLCAPPDNATPGLYECPAQLEAQLTYLRDNGWRSITADDLADLMANRQCPDPKRFVISFDDGYSDAYDNAAPVLEGLGMRGTMYVIPGKAGRPGYMTFDQMRDLVARGHAIGDHSLTHKDMRVLTADQLHDEVEGAQQMLDSELGYRPRTFAYPYGRYNDAVVQEVANSGLELAFTVHRGARESSLAPLISKRLRVAQRDSPADVLARLAPYEEGCAPPTADLAVATSSSGPFKGDGIYSSVPLRSQSVSRTGVRAGHTYSYWVHLGNDGQFGDTFDLTVRTESTAQMDVRYRVDGVDVTPQVVGGSYARQLGPWGSMTMVVQITPIAPASAGYTRVFLHAQPRSEPSAVDVARVSAAY